MAGLLDTINKYTGGPVTTVAPSSATRKQENDPGFRAFVIKAAEMGAPTPTYEQYVSVMAKMGIQPRAAGAPLPAPYSGDPATRGLLGQ